jgi:hypothetical protein
MVFTITVYAMFSAHYLVCLITLVPWSGMVFTPGADKVIWGYIGPSGAGDEATALSSGSDPRFIVPFIFLFYGVKLRTSGSPL